MIENNTNMSPDPYLMSIQQKRDFFERSSSNENQSQPAIAKASSVSSLPMSVPRKKRTESFFSDKSTSTVMTSNTINTPTSVRQQWEKLSSYSSSSPYGNNISCSVSHIINNLNKSSSSSSQKSAHVQSQKSMEVVSHRPTMAVSTDASSSSMSMKEFNDVFRDLDTFIGKELNEIECRKRLGMIKKDTILKEIKDRNVDQIEEEIKCTLRKLKDDVNEIRENQKGFEEKMRKHELNQIYARKKNEFEMSEKAKVQERIVAEMPSPKKPPMLEKAVQYTSEEETLTPASLSSMAPPPSRSDISERLEKLREFKKPASVASSNASIITESGFSRSERIRKLELEIYKEETLMMKINRVLENIKQVDERNLSDIINIERHYLVASTRFQSALSELRKINDCSEPLRMPPFNRKGKLYVRDIMLEVKSSYFQRPTPSSNEFLLVVMKYEDKIYATRPVRITDDVRIVKFSEKFSIPEIYMDFDMRLEIYGTTFWRKNSSIRDTMLKKYGFITFSLADTGKKSKRFDMIETLQSDNVPIRNKVVMKISQKITTDIKYKGQLYVKLRDVWHETSARLNGHLLEFTFAKKNLGSDFIRSQETMMLDLYNADCDAVVPVDSRRISDKSFTFLIKFNHYVDITNFYIMAAADNDEHFFEWVSALNKVLALIK